MSPFQLGLLLASLAAAPAAPCQPVAGLETLLKPARVLLLGELHGTVESPGFAGDVACHAARTGLPVVVGLELPVGGQARVDAFLGSDGGAEARQALLADPFWQRGYQDGRTSLAMLELIERIARLRRDGAEIEVMLFDTGGRAGGQARDRGMAGRLARDLSEETRAMAVILTGNLHSRTRLGRPGNADYEPMGYLLARSLVGDRVVSLNAAHGGGSAWICSRTCGPAELGGDQPGSPWAIETGAELAAGHDGRYRVGVITASPPAVASASELASVVPPSRLRVPEPSPRVGDDGPLSAEERRMQGRWQGYDAKQGNRTWSLEVSGRAFRAEGSGEWYEGRLVVRSDRQPAWMDFVIERCRCAYEGATSESVFRWSEDALLVAATPPGNPRPTSMDGGSAQLLRFEPLLDP